jgi:hypothetical protein
MVGVLALALAACGGSSSNNAGKQPSGSSGPGTTVHVAKAATDRPSISAQMICQNEAKQEIADSATGVDTIKPLNPTWKNHIYSCDYVYPNGTMTLSVKELSNADETTAYFNELAQKLGKSKVQYNIGQGAFSTNNGSLVARKDYKVMLVDVSKLPASFGVPPDTREHVAINVASTIMNCWSGE